MSQAEDIQRLFDLAEKQSAASVTTVLAQARNDEQIKTLVNLFNDHLKMHDKAEERITAVEKTQSNLGWKVASTMWGVVLLVAGWAVSAWSK